MSEDRYVFIVQWFDTAASLIRPYNLIYYTKDNTIEMFDLKNKKIFLKRTAIPTLQLKDIFIGATLSIYSRQLKVSDYADAFTKSKFEAQKGKAFVLIKPDAYLRIGKIVNILEQNGFKITNLRMAKLSKSQAQNLFASARGKANFSENCSHCISDLSLGLQVMADNCIELLRRTAGCEDPNQARKDEPESIRALFGQNVVKNAVFTSQSASSAAKELQLFFNSGIQCPANFNSCTCMVIKPHLVAEGYIGQIVDAVLNAGFQISAAQTFNLNRPNTQEFLEVYKNVIPEYNQVVEEMTNGPCVALQVRQDKAVTKLRELCGPHDPEMARTVRPKSLRAVYGKDKGKNGVHCTDLEEDGVLEVEYFFNILQK